MMTDTQRDQLLADYRQRQACAEWFIVEGRWPVEALLASSLEVKSLVLEAGRHAHLQELAQQRAPILQLSAAEIADLMGFSFHRGVLACARRPQPQALSANQGCIVVCPQMADESNLGAIVRNAAAFGVTAVVVPAEQGADVYSRKSIRASSGTVFRVPIMESPDLLADVVRLKSQGFQVVGTSVTEPFVPIREANFAPNVVLVLGSEETGIGEPWQAVCDVLVSIPMASGIDSLNVACSSAILLYEIGKR